MKVEVKKFFILKWQNKISPVLKWDTSTVLISDFLQMTAHRKSHWITFFFSNQQFNIVTVLIASYVVKNMVIIWFVRAFWRTDVVIYNMIWPSSHYVSEWIVADIYVSVSCSDLILQRVTDTTETIPLTMLPLCCSLYIWKYVAISGRPLKVFLYTFTRQILSVRLKSQYMLLKITMIIF